MRSITCPKCRMTSYHPEDVKHGYCGNCHEFTSEVKVANGDDKNDPFTDAGAVEAGRIAYNAYGRAVRFRNFQGDPMPDWGSLSDEIQKGWTMAARAVAEKVIMSAVGSLAPRDAQPPISRRQDF